MDGSTVCSSCEFGGIWIDDPFHDPLAFHDSYRCCEDRSVNLHAVLTLIDAIVRGPGKTWACSTCTRPVVLATARVALAHCHVVRSMRYDDALG